MRGKNNLNKKKGQKTGNGGRTVLSHIIDLVIGVIIGVVVLALIMRAPWKGGNSTESGSKGQKAFQAADYVDLPEYKGITASIAVTQEDIDAEIENLQDDNIVYEEKQGTIQDGDKVYAEFTGYIDGKKVEDTSGSDYVEIGSGDWLKGFDTAFIGKKTGEEFRFEVDVPDGTYGDDSIDGKKVTFRAKAHYICGEEIVPEYNDDLVQSATKYNSVEEYNEHLKKELAEEFEAEKAEYSWSEVLDNSKVKEYPEDMLKDAEEEVLQGYYDMADLYGVSHDEIFQTFGNEDEQDFVENDLQELAEDTVKERLVVLAIADKEDISYTGEAYQEIVEEEYSYNEDEYDSQEAYEKDNEKYLTDLALTEAVKNWIAERANFLTEEGQESRDEDGNERVSD